MKEMETEDLISSLMLYVSRETTEFSTAKRLAVERYMRALLRALTRSELEIALKVCLGSEFLDPDLDFKLNQASRGYDRYMSGKR